MDVPAVVWWLTVVGIVGSANGKLAVGCSTKLVL